MLNNSVISGVLRVKTTKKCRVVREVGQINDFSDFALTVCDSMFKIKIIPNSQNWLIPIFSISNL
jgi:hypothetical protein